MKRQGVIYNMPSEDYHSGPELSSTAISVFINKSPAHYRLMRDGKWSPVSTAFKSGNAAHVYLLERKEFFERYAVGPDARRNSKEWKEWADDQSEGVELLKASEFNRDVRPLYDRVTESCAEAKWLLDQPGKTEVSFFWTDQKTGISCRGRADKLIDTGKKLIAVDIKTTKNAAPSAFSRSIADYGYHRQNEFYQGGLQQITGRQVLFVFLAIETGSMVAACYTLAKEAKMKARVELDDAMLAISQCQANNHWPGYTTRIEEIDLPKWSYRDE